MRWVLSVCSFLLTVLGAGEVRLHPLFGSHMVFQRNAQAPIWGWAGPGEKVTIRTTWGANATATAGPDGRWKTKVTTKGAGGPYEVAVSGENSLWLRNVMVGEVWVCSGQSNMEWPLGTFPGMTPVRNSNEEVAAALFPSIRLFNVKKARSITIEEACEGSWSPCSPESVHGFSATAYFFGRMLHQRLGVPIGLIETAWGGTEVELWTSEPALRRMPGFSEAIDNYSTLQAEARKTDAERTHKLAEDARRGWEREDVDESGWTRLADPVPFPGNYDGSIWYRARLLLTPEQAKGPATLSLGAIDDQDVTYVNGTKVGATDTHDRPRAYPVPPGVLREGLNTVTIRAVDVGGEGGFTQPGSIGLTVGTARVPLTNWRMKPGFDYGPPTGDRGRPYSLLYNAMIAPLIPFRIQGAIWYQGESNVSRAFQYRTSFPNMIRNWREDWGQGEFPFYFVQIAPFNYNQNGASAELREAQAMTVSDVPNTGMAVAADAVPNLNDIHPPFKQEVGDRLARLALLHTYGLRDVAAHGPTYRSVHFADRRATIGLAHADGLRIDGEKLLGVEIAGEDKVFHPGEAKIEGGNLVVWSDAVAKPIAVRFGWKDAVLSNLFNGAGLPAPPFRTDAWPGLTEAVKW